MATTGTGTLLPAGQAVAYNVGTATNVAAITASGTTSLAVTTGTGLPTMTGGGSGGGGGAATIASGADVTEGATTDTTCSSTHTLSGCLYALNQTAQTGSGTTGSAVPSSAIFTGAVSSGNLTGIIQADASAPINVSTATTTQIVGLVSAKKIYVTSYNVIAGGTGNITWVYGTGSNCGTGTTSLTGAYNLTAQAGIAMAGGLGPVLVVPAGNALCVTTTAAVQMSGAVSYTQF